MMSPEPNLLQLPSSRFLLLLPHIRRDGFVSALLAPSPALSAADAGSAQAKGLNGSREKGRRASR